MIEIVPNWHPVLVHFTVALVVVAVVLHMLSGLFPEGRREQARTVARWNLILGAGFAIATVIAGFQAYFTVAHDGPSHAAMIQHRNWALAALFLILGLALWQWRLASARLSALFVVGSVVTGLVLVATAYKGGELVFVHGLGVQSLPQSEGQGHDHGDGGHDHGSEDPEAEAGTVASPISPLGADGPAGAIEAFHGAMATGDVEAVERLLDPKVLIYESGGAERSFTEYSGHHMPGDMAHAAATSRVVERRHAVEDGDAAWVVSESRISGERRGKPVNSRVMETAVLRRTDGVWRITHIHWSSRNLKRN